VEGGSAESMRGHVFDFHRRRRSVGQLAFVALQILVPIWAWILGSPYFAWNMYSYLQNPPQIIVIRPGTVDTMLPQRYLGFARGDLSYGHDMGAQICRIERDALVIRVLPHHGAMLETKCR
jgi:hypothetical protein